MLALSPVMRTSMSSILRMTAAPPPMLSPRTSIALPAASTMRTSMVLGWSYSASGSVTNENASPASRARSKESRMRRSSVASPSMPATRALSVPWPVSVCANDPSSLNSTVFGSARHSRRAM